LGNGVSHFPAYGLRPDIVKHFPSIDHAILLDILAREPHDERVMDLAARIIAGGDGVEQG
jgi:RNA-directed DNA polymerase